LTVEAMRHRKKWCGAGAVVVLLAVALSHSTVAGAQEGGDRKPAELWKTYPLDPREGEKPTLGGAPSMAGTEEFPPPARDDSSVASSASSEGPISKTILYAVIAATLIVGVAAVALSIGNRPAWRLPATAGSVARTQAAEGHPALSAMEAKSLRSPSSPMAPFRPTSPTKKGSSMVNFRRKPDDEEGAMESQNRSATGDDSQPGSGEHEDVRVMPSEGPETETISSDEALPAYPSFGEEVQTILDSAQAAAGKIRSRAEEEADQIRAEAAASAEAERVEAERLRSEAEAYARDTRAAADEAAQQRRSEADDEAAHILEEAERRRSAIDAELAEKVEYAKEEVQNRIGTLQGEIQRQEERLESIAVVLGSMTSQVTRLLDRHEESNLTDDLTNLTGKAVEGN
jgi:hypothetical protein